MAREKTASKTDECQQKVVAATRPQPGAHTHTNNTLTNTHTQISLIILSQYNNKNIDHSTHWMHNKHN